MGLCRAQVLGCLYGGALGDAFASASEHRVGVDASAYEPDWQVTDDTQLTVATCEAILKGAGRVSAEQIAASLGEAYVEGKLTGLGSSTLGALRALSRGGHWALSGISGERAAGNGAAMRIAPVALLLDLEEWGDRQVFGDVVRITHKNEEALAGAQALARSIRYLMEHRSPRPEALYAAVASGLFDSHTRDRIEQMAKEPLGSYEEAASQIGTSGFAAHSVPVAMVAAMEVIGGDGHFEAIMRQVVACGGDTDTIASMAGQLSGVARGFDALPAEFLVNLRARAPYLDAVFEDFCAGVMSRGCRR